jgi:hypothetical protein
VSRPSRQRTGPRAAAGTAPATRIYTSTTREEGGRIPALSRLKAKLGLVTALAMSGILLVTPAVGHKPKPAGPVPAAAAWPNAKRGVILANLPDGTAYQPGIFLDARTSIGTALSRDGRFQRLVMFGPGTAVRQLRRLPAAGNPSFPAFTVTGSTLVWAESENDGRTRLWSIDLRRGAPRELTADTGAAGFYHSQYDLVVAGGRVHWVATGTGGVTEVRSVALAGGAVDSRTESGMWQLSAWPWLVNGVTDSVGATVLRNLDTGRDVAIAHSGGRATTNCSPVWCRVASIDDRGLNRIDVMRPDGTARRRVAGDPAATIIGDVAPLDRFDVISQVDPNAELNGNVQLLVIDLVTHSTIEVSPEAAKVSYRNGVLWWATGNQQSFIWHSVDLRTI